MILKKYKMSDNTTHPSDFKQRADDTRALDETGWVFLVGGRQESRKSGRGRGCITSTPKSVDFLIFRPFLAKK